MLEQMKQDLRHKSKGQIGIEVLVIFIAMILVAGIAATVFINTANSLRNQAEKTSEDSTAQVSNSIQVLSAVGQVDADANVTALNFTVMESPGADEIDLAEATIEYISPTGKTTLIYGTSAGYNLSGNNQATFSVDSLKDDDGSNPVLNSGGDRFSVNMNLDNSYPSALAELHGGDSATVTFVTQSGSSYTYIVNVPPSLSSDKGGVTSV